MTDIEYRPLKGIAEFKAAEEMQRTVWGEGDKEDPFDLMMVVQNEGGLVGGAFRQGRLLGYVFGFPTRDPEVQYSHRLAVLPEARGLGLGAGLKRYQRRWCLDNGIRRIRWTYDPLRLTNAALNIRVLGGQASTYYQDFYGEMTGINSGAPSDRLRLDWHLDDPAVERRALGDREPLALSGDILEIVIPQGFEEAMTADPETATRLRLESRAEFERAFADGFVVRDFEPSTRAYRLVRP
ncbi:GNAT family N-acetyltransferase [Gellertiella hungarica]|uniref:Putative GNAT superfamily acetyltransferase n=1 Tax=Gellertiella hungarica TaxID=1572859 RepID=A0A7W6J8C2_9HYPH|nr:GNAT family N-acetyltransferase [Gellertiella hungarica]MBB4065778.1 putative GNAT superfamily acetyltransferase [Gellertiella hungarica]